MAFELSNEMIGAFFLLAGILGSGLNGLMISTFFHNIRFHGAEYQFLGLTILCDFVTTFGVFGFWSGWIVADSVFYKNFFCNMGYFLATLSVFSFSLFSMIASIVQFSTLKNRVAAEKTFDAKLNITIAAVIASTIFIYAWIGMVNDLDPDFCEFTNNGNKYYRDTTAVIFIVLPCMINVYYKIAAVIAISKNIKKKRYRNSKLFRDDRIMLIINTLIYTTFLSMWAPYALKVWWYKSFDKNDVYLFAAIGMSRTIFNSLFYLIRAKFTAMFIDVTIFTCFKRYVFKRFRNRRGPNHITPGENAHLYLKPNIKPMVIHDPVMLKNGIVGTEV